MPPAEFRYRIVQVTFAYNWLETKQRKELLDQLTDSFDSP
jgi:hypothetical protein